MAIDNWTKVYQSACSDARLDDRDFRVLVAVKLRTREHGSCWENVASIGLRAGGMKERTVQRSLKSLKRLGYIKEVRDSSKRTGRRLMLGYEVVSSAPSNLTVDGVKYDGGPVSNMTPNQEHLIKRKEEEGRCHSLRETTLSSEEPLRLEDDEKMLPELTRMIEGIVDPEVSKGVLRSRVTRCGKWLAARFMDEPRERHYFSLLYEVAGGELPAESFLEAFGDTWTAFLEGRAADPGPYFSGALRNIRSDMAHEEVEAEIRAGVATSNYSKTRSE